VVVESDEVEVVSEFQLGGTWEATLRARPDVDPRFLGLTAVEAETGIREIGIRGLEVGCHYTFDIQAGDQQMRMPVEFKCGERQTVANAEWRRDGRLMGTSRYVLSRLTLPQLELHRVLDGMDVDRRQARDRDPLGISAEAEEKLRALVQKNRACNALPRDQQQSCLEDLEPERERVDALLAGPYGCAGLQVTASHGTFLHGKATLCAGHSSGDLLLLKGQYTSP